MGQWDIRTLCIVRDVCITHPVTYHWPAPPATQDDQATAKHGTCSPLKIKAHCASVHGASQDLPHHYPSNAVNTISSCAFRLASLFYSSRWINMIIITTMSISKCKQSSWRPELTCTCAFRLASLFYHARWINMIVITTNSIECRV